jgi:hypothetical protein
MTYLAYALAAFAASSLALALAAWVYANTIEPFAAKSTGCALLVTPFALALWLFDVAYNATFGSIMFAQLPFAKDPIRRRRAGTFSDRLQHICTDFDFLGTRRRWMAKRIARLVNWLWPNHIRI